MFFWSRGPFSHIGSNWTGIVKSHYGLLGLIAPNHCSARAVLIAFNGICRRGRPSLLLPGHLGSYFLVLRSPGYFIRTWRYTAFKKQPQNRIACWPSYVITSDGRQPSVQRCDVCDVSFQSIMHSCLFFKYEECHNVHLFFEYIFLIKTHVFF